MTNNSKSNDQNNQFHPLSIWDRMDMQVFGELENSHLITNFSNI